MKKLLSIFLLLTILLNIVLTDVYANEDITTEEEITEDESFVYEPLPDFGGDWVNFRSNDENMGITYTQTPRKPEETDFKWAKKHSNSYFESITPPVIVNDNLYIANGDRILILDKFTGDELMVSEPLQGSVGYALNPVTYGGGMIFVPISGGRIQALRADTLESLWVSNALGGQSLSPVTYKDGYVFCGTWSGENKDGKYYCLDVTDEDIYVSDEVKEPLWELTHTGGFYWAGAYAGDGFVIFGSDDGKKGYDNIGSVLYSVSVEDGSLIDTIVGIKGDIRSSVSYDISSSYLYFSSKCGDFHRVILNSDGSFDHTSHEYINVGNMTTSTPIIYGDIGFCGVCGEEQFSDDGHSYAVIDTSGERMSIICYEAVPGYVQISALLSVAYENDFNKLYLYLTYNMEPGGIYVLEIKKASDGISVKGNNLFLPTDDMQGYCVCSLVCDADGNIYYKNDSGYLFCIGKSVDYDFYSEADITEQIKDEAIAEITSKYDEAVLYLGDDLRVQPLTEIISEYEQKIHNSYDEDEIKKHLSECLILINNILNKKDVSSDNKVIPSSDSGEVFSDISGHKYKDAVLSMYHKGVVKGVTEDLFYPEREVTRAEFVSFLYRLSGEKNADDKTVYEDVDKSSWYYDAVMWANDAGIVMGLGENKFGPNQYVTNEQIAVFITRYIKHMGYTLDDSRFDMRLYDYTSISHWAIGEVIYCTGYGIMRTDKGAILSTAPASRAQVCDMLNSLLKCTVTDKG